MNRRIVWKHVLGSRKHLQSGCFWGVERDEQTKCRVAIEKDMAAINVAITGCVPIFTGIPRPEFISRQGLVYAHVRFNGHFSNTSRV